VRRVTTACTFVGALVGLSACHLASGLADFQTRGEGGAASSSTSGRGGSSASTSSTSSSGGGEPQVPFACYAGPFDDFDEPLDFQGWDITLDPNHNSIVPRTTNGALEIRVLGGLLSAGDQAEVRVEKAGGGDLRSCAYVTQLAERHPHVQEWGVRINAEGPPGAPHDSIYFRLDGTTLHGVLDPAGPQNRYSVFSLPFDEEEHVWFAIWVDDGEVVWATSPDGYAYRRHGGRSSYPFANTEAEVVTYSLSVRDDTPGAARWELLNLPPP